MTKETLFAQALAKSPEERSAFLDEACDGDLELRERIEQLLDAHGEPLGSPPQSAAEDFDATLAMSGSPSNASEATPPQEYDFDATLPQNSAPPSSDPVSIVMKGAEDSLSTLGADPDAAVPFIFGQRIAQGGMGAILEASDQKLGRTIAAKVMLSTGVTNTDDQKRFVQEAAVLGKLEHPNIVPIHDLGRDSESQLYYTMKMVQGRTLQDIIDDLQAKDAEVLAHYTLERLLTIFRKICDAMAFAHSRKIIHRDLKPENIMVGEFGEVLVMDWGLSKVLDGSAEIPVAMRGDGSDAGTGSFTATLQGSVMGTPKYMSPEQAMGEIDELDERSDIFSLGGVLYAILTLHPPVEGKTLEEVLDKVSRASISPPTKYGTTARNSSKQKKGAVLEAKAIKPLPHIREGQVPAALSAVAMKALSLKKKDRYQEVADVSSDIEKYQNGFATSAEKAGLGTQLKLLIKRNKGIFTTAAAAWLLITALAVWFVLSVQSKERETRKAFAQASVSLADAALREGNGPAMQAALADVPVTLRDSTWHYLQNQSDTTIAKIDMGYPIYGIAAHPRLPHVFALAGQNRKISMVNVATGVRLLEFEVDLPSNQELVIAFSPDGERVAIGPGKTGAGIAIHNARDGKRLLAWDTGKCFDLEFSSDGKSLVHAQIEPGVVNLWDATSGQLRWEYSSGRNEVTKVAFTADGSGVIAKTHPAGLFRINADDGSIAWQNMSVSGRSLAVNSDVSRLVVGMVGGIARCVDPASGEILYEFRVNSRFLPRSDHLVYSGDRFGTVSTRTDGRISVEFWNAATGNFTQRLLGGNGAATRAAVHSLSGELIVAGSRLFVWDLAGDPEWIFLGPPNSSLAFWGDDETIFMSGTHLGRGLLSLEETDATHLWKPSQSFYGPPSVSANGSLAVNSDIGCLLLRRNEDQVEEIGNVRDERKYSNAELLRLSPRGDTLASVYRRRGQITVIDSVSGDEPVQLYRTGIFRFNDLGWIDDKHLLGLVIANADRGSPESEERIVKWDVTSGEIIKSTAIPTATNVLVVAPDGRRFAEAGADKKVRIRDTDTLAVLREFRAHDDDITAMAWHPHQPVLATGSADLAIRLWDLETGEQIDELRGPYAAPRSLAFSPGGSRLACTSNDNFS